MPASFTFERDLLDQPILTGLPGVRLAKLSGADAPAMAEGLSDLDVAKFLVAVPHPYSVEDARIFIAGPAASPHMLCAALTVDGDFAGCVAIDATGGAPELGYWLATRCWGRGIMTAAVRAMVDFAFRATALERIVSGHFLDNEPSSRILAGRGFRKTGIVETRSRARREPVRLSGMALERDRWAAAQPAIETPRLVMRPLALADVGEIAALADGSDVALTTALAPHPRGRDEARAFVVAAARQGAPGGARFTIRLKSDGALVGGVGWSTTPNDGGIELDYRIGAAHRGLGLATEAARAALDAAFEATGATLASASCRATDPSSRGVLERCGFRREASGTTPDGEAQGLVAVDRFELDRDMFLSLKAWGAPAGAASR